MASRPRRHLAGRNDGQTDAAQDPSSESSITASSGDENQEVAQTSSGTVATTMQDHFPQIHADTAVSLHPSRRIVLLCLQCTQLITTHTRDYFSAKLARRLNTLVQWGNEATSCFSVKMLPVGTLKWGKEGYGPDDVSEFLCVDDKPVTLWIAGEVVVPSFVKDGYGKRKAGLLVRPLLQSDYIKCNKIINRFSKPRPGMFTCRYITLRLTQISVCRVRSHSGRGMGDALDGCKVDRRR